MDSGCRELKFSGGSGINMDGETTERNGERAMNKDMCVVCDNGILNIRAGAIIRKDGKLLMVSNDRDYLYSVGGRVKQRKRRLCVKCWKKPAFRWKLTVLALCMKTISMGMRLPIGTS